MTTYDNALSSYHQCLAVILRALPAGKLNTTLSRRRWEVNCTLIDCCFLQMRYEPDSKEGAFICMQFSALSFLVHSFITTVQQTTVGVVCK